MTTQDTVRDIAGLQTTIVEATAESGTAVVLLHGYAMQPEDLAPFAHSLKLPARFFFPRAPLSAVPQGYAWWSVDTTLREEARRRGPRDLAGQRPAGLLQARERLSLLLAAIEAEFKPRRVILGGFSQGGMLACDFVLHCAKTVQALVLLSASRIDLDTWQQCRARLRGLPVFLSHGRQDTDLAFSAGEELRDFAAGAGGLVTWFPFDSGHDIPLVVWRQLRKFLKPLL